LTQAEIPRPRGRAESIRKEQQTADQKLAAQLTQAQKDNEEKLGAVATEVAGAKKDIEATKKRSGSDEKPKWPAPWPT